MRISRQQLFMEFAHSAAKRSTCSRLNVGAVLVYLNNTISIGYNGPPAGEPHCIGNDCPGRKQCHLSLHAEENAISRVPSGTRFAAGAGCDLYATHSPCPACVDVINDAPMRISRVFFGAEFRDTTKLHDLTARVYQVLPSGFIMDFRTRELVNADAL